MSEQISPRAAAWATTMAGHAASDDVVTAHRDTHVQIEPGPAIGRVAREEREHLLLRPGATFSQGAGNRERAERPDAERTCFERDRDRIVHSPAFRRLAGKTQVVVHPRDHERTRLTHALEVAQVATSIARAVGANVALTDAIALGHDCGHGPGGHASEDAFDRFLDGGYDHGPWGADVVLTPLNLCAETLDGIRNHSWSRPAPATIEGEIVSWSDRIAYCAHDLEDAVHAGIVTERDLPASLVEVAGATRREQLGVFIRAVIRTTCATGRVGMDADTAAALASLRAFNYERIYTRAESLAQSKAVVDLLDALVRFYLEHPERMPPEYVCADDRVHGVIAYVGGMTDRFAFGQAVDLLGWRLDRLPRAIG